MSIWTYVNGFVKFDRTINKEELGHIVTFNDLISEDVEPCTSLPMGSEGSLDYELFDNYAIYNSSLRDFTDNDVKELVEYFTNLYNHPNFDNISIQIAVTTGERYCIYYDWKKDSILSSKLVSE